MIPVTDHAVVRFLERRVKGIDVEGIRRQQVTDHAVMRHLEREGIDVEGFRRQIAESLGSPSTKRLIEFSGGANCKIKKGNAVYCLRGKTVTTYIAR